MTTFSSDISNPNFFHCKIGPLSQDMIWSDAICWFLFLGNEKNQPGKVNILAWKVLSQKSRCLFILISHWTKHPPFVKCLSVSSDVDVLWCEIKNMLCLLFLHFELHPPLLNNGQKCRPFFANMPTNRLTDNWQLFLFQISHFLFISTFTFSISLMHTNMADTLGMYICQNSVHYFHLIYLVLQVFLQRCWHHADMHGISPCKGVDCWHVWQFHIFPFKITGCGKQVLDDQIIEWPHRLVRVISEKKQDLQENSDF